MIDQIVALDDAIREWVVVHRAHALDAPMLMASAIGREGQIWFIVGGLLVLMRQIRLQALVPLVCAIVLATLAADHIVKPAINRDRPFVRAPDVQVIGSPPGGPSFPSGHAANAFAGAFILSRLLPAASLAWWAIAVAIAYSRVYLGVHYPLDVIGGAIIGVASAALVAMVISRVAPPSRWSG